MYPKYITNDLKNYATLDATHLEDQLMNVIFDNLFTIRRPDIEVPHHSADVLERIMLSAETKIGGSNQISVVFDLAGNNCETDHPKVVKKYTLTLTEDDDPNFDPEYYEALPEDDEDKDGDW